MKLIADSGSTKTEWAVINNGKLITKIESEGINPLFRTSNDIAEELKPKLQFFANKIKEIHYYGSGIINDAKANVVKQALYQIIGNAECNIESDILGAARAVCGRDEGIVCIIGTGSNSAFYNGNKVTRNIPPLGFVLGDEASGAVMGKNILSDYFKGIMPEELQTQFKNIYNLSKEEVIERVYRTEKPNKFLAQFAKFISVNISHIYCQEFVKEQFSIFLNRNVLQLPNAQKYSINFVGSIAYTFNSELTEVLKIKELKVGKIVKNPIDNLINFHL